MAIFGEHIRDDALARTPKSIDRRDSWGQPCLRIVPGESVMLGCDSRFSAVGFAMSGASRRAMRRKRRPQQPAPLAKTKGTLTPSPAIDDRSDQVPIDDDIFAALESFVDCVTAHGADDPLAADCLDLVQRQLELIRYRSDRGYDDAIRLIEEFQRAIAGLVATGRIGGLELSMLGSALHQAGIAASAEFTAALERSAESFVADEAPAGFAAMLVDLAAQCGDDPFVVTSMLAETGHGLPAQARGLMVGELVRCPNSVLRDAATMQLLDADPEVRHAVAAALLARIADLTPASLRRLIMMRNWHSDAERTLIDPIIRAARAKGIDCAAPPDGHAETILASGIEGSGAQGFLILSPAGRRKRLSSVLFKNGVRDAWSGLPESRRDIETALAQAVAETSMMPVSRGYFDRAARHHLALGLAAGICPPAGLLQVAETIGGAPWQPERLDWRQALSALAAELPADRLAPDAVCATLHASDKWANFDTIVESWFEDDQDVARRVAGTRGRQRTKAVKYVLQNVLEQRRERWAELFLLTAVWLKEAPDNAALPWREFVVLARALADGHDLSDIALMCEIADRTVSVLAFE